MLYKLENLDPMTRPHKDSKTAVKWVISCINDCLPKINSNYIITTSLVIKEILTTAVADNESSILRDANDRLATQFIIGLHNAANPKGRYTTSYHLKNAKDATAQYLKCIRRRMNRDDEWHKYHF